MKATNRKICFFALFSIVSIAVSFVALAALFLVPVYLRGEQPYKVVYFISKLSLVLFPLSAVLLGHTARYKIKHSYPKLSGKVFVVISLIFGYFFLILIAAFLFLLSQIRICGTPKQRTKSTLAGLELALQQYKNDIGSFPSGTSKDIANAISGFRNSSDTLDDMYTKNPKWRGPYWTNLSIEYKNSLKNQEILDSWKKPYNFSFKNDEIFIWSCGPNRKNENGAGDDISNK